MRNFIYKFSAFMQGRNGFDELNWTLIVLSLILNVVSGFFWYYPTVRLVLKLVSLAFVLLFIFRFLSTNLYRRGQENRFFKPAIRGTIDWFKITYKKLRDGRTHRYYKCPNCKAQLRVKNIKGTHTIRCPKCGTHFEKKIR